jgi:hypothetical protein
MTTIYVAKNGRTFIRKKNGQTIFVSNRFVKTNAKRYRR